MGSTCIYATRASARPAAAEAGPRSTSDYGEGGGIGEAEPRVAAVDALAPQDRGATLARAAVGPEAALDRHAALLGTARCDPAVEPAAALPLHPALHAVALLGVLGHTAICSVPTAAARVAGSARLGGAMTTPPV